jgi:GTPase involved in cell partitioning and DNA repair
MTLSSQYDGDDTTAASSTAAVSTTMLVADMSTDGITILLAKGGKPGLGNQIMAGSRRHKSMVCIHYSILH